METVHTEAERQKAEGQAAIARLEHELNASRERVGSEPPPREADPVTSKSEPEKALRSAVSSPEGIYFVVVIVNRVSAVNANPAS